MSARLSLKNILRYSTKIIKPFIEYIVTEGRVYTYDLYVPSLADNDIKYVIIESPSNRDTHFYMKVSSAGDCRILSWENAETLNDGDVYSGFNRVVGKESSITNIYSDATITVDSQGTSRGDIFIPAGSGGNTTGGTARGNISSVVPAGTRLLLGVNNISGQVRRIGISIDFWEQEQRFK